MRRKHAPPDSTLFCPVCNKLYTNKSYLKEHLQTHNPDHAFKCPHCQKKFSSKSNLRKHIHKHSPGYTPAKDKRRYEPRMRKHECSECQKMFDSPHSLEVLYIQPTPSPLMLYLWTVPYNLTPLTLARLPITLPYFLCSLPLLLRWF